MPIDDFALGYQDGRQDRRETSHGMGERERYQIIHGHLPKEDKLYWDGYHKGWLAMPNQQVESVKQTFDGQRVMTSCAIRGMYNNDHGRAVYIDLAPGAEGDVYLAQDNGAMVHFPILKKRGFTGIWLDNKQMSVAKG